MAFTKAKTFTDQIDCIACETLLPDYVRLQLTNQPAEAAYPAVAFHIETCPTCQALYFQEFRAQGLAKPLAELQQVGRRTAVAPALAPIITPVRVGLWQRVAENLQRLTVEILIVVQKTATAFGQLPTLLTPHLTLLDALQRAHRPTPGNTVSAIELLTLPDPTADVQIKVSTGTVTDHKSMLIVQFETLTTHEPIAQARTLLRDEHGSLLEQRATDVDGLVIFGDLELAKYSIQIKQAGQTWEFSVKLTEVS